MIQNFKMADVGEKPMTHRIACAKGRIHMGEEAFCLIQQNQLPKGNPIPMAETAGVLAVKKTAELLPLCHPLILDKVEFQFEWDMPNHAIEVTCRVSTHAKTGVEMEALLGVQIALLTIYDLTKPVDPALTITDIRLESKQGGKRGLWMHPNSEHFAHELSFKDIRTAILTVSDRASAGIYPDKTGEVMQQILEHWGNTIVDTKVIPDEKNIITEQLLYMIDTLKTDLVITMGGTGISKRDHTPEVAAALCDRMLPGLGELLRQHGALTTPYAWLSRAIAGIRQNTLIMTLPGSPKAVRESMEALKTPLLHALQQLKV